MSYDSVFLLNGVAITENIRGQPVSLFIEDAIQETTVLTSGISAEYGRFGGGLVNAITKSGGNEFSGSYRLGMNNDNWRAVTPFNETKLDKVVPTHEYTIGGPVVRDTLWFFNAGRFQTQEQSFQTNVTNLSYPRTNNEKRYEGKLTYTVRPGQVVKGSYTKIQQAIINTGFQNIMDMRSLYNQEQPQDLLSLNYNGVMGTKLFLEGQYSQRHLSFVTSGAGATDLVNGTLLIDLSRGNAFRYWSPTFCVCNIDKRDNSEVLAKATYFLSTSRRGAHTVVFGYDRYNDQRTADNHQSGSDYRIRGTSTVIRGETIYPVFLNNNSTFIQHDPITLASTGSDIRTHALFVNDNWRLNEGISINLGLRWDKNQGNDAAGNLISDASKLSHRIGIAWDPRGDGKWAINASTSRYVSGISGAIAETSPAGTASSYSWFYQGPSINADPNGALVTPDAAIQQVFNWFNANGATNRPFAEPPTVQGVNTRIGETLDSPNSIEYAAGVSRLVGERGSVRLDWVFRDFNDFYITRTDLSTGTTTDALGRPYDVNLIENSNDLERRYQGGTVQANYRFGSGIELGGNYTLSRTWGNFDGENPASGPLTAQLFSYPEYREAEWNQADGNLGTDQRHRSRIWGTYHVPMSSTAGSLDIGVIYSAASGTPYTFGGAAATSPGTGIGQINSSPYVTNPGYVNPVTRVEYYFFPRDEYRTEAQFRTDLSVNYQYRLPGGADVFFHGEVVNIFNQYQLCGCGGTVFNNGGGSDIRTINNAVLTSVNSAALQAFNPFTTVPVQGVHWNLSPTFGTPANRFAYTSPRTFRFNFGVKF